MTRARDMANIAAGSFDVPSVADGIITSAKLASGAITSANLPSGTVLQVKSTIYSPNRVATTNTAMQDTGLSLSMTLSSSSNKVFIMVNGGHCYVESGFSDGLIETICRTSSTTYSTSNDLNGGEGFGFGQLYNAAYLNTGEHSMAVLDETPGSTSAAYRCFFRSRSGGSVVWHENNASNVTMTLMEIAG